jgi:hypothetical protein
MSPFSVRLQERGDMPLSTTRPCPGLVDTSNRTKVR